MPIHGPWSDDVVAVNEGSRQQDQTPINERDALKAAPPHIDHFLLRGTCPQYVLAILNACIDVPAAVAGAVGKMRSERAAFAVIEKNV